MSFGKNTKKLGKHGVQYEENKMCIKSDLEKNVTNKHIQRINAIAYSTGHYDAKQQALKIAHKYDKLINTLFDALCDRHADELVDELKEEYEL
jgi:hypothetical protein